MGNSHLLAYTDGKDVPVGQDLQADDERIRLRAVPEREREVSLVVCYQMRQCFRTCFTDELQQGGRVDVLLAVFDGWSHSCLNACRMTP